MAGLTREQRTWLKDLGSLVGETAVAELEESPEEVSPKEKLVGGGDAKALLGLPFIPEIPLVTTRITIKNKTSVALRVVSGSAKLENAQASFAKAPDVDIAGPSDSDFSITNESKIPLVPRLGGTGGEIRYDIVGDEKKAQLFMKWERGGIDPARKPTQSITPNDGRFDVKGVNSGGDDFQFDFTSKGGTPPGPGPGPTPPPGPGPAPNVPSSCLITVTNETDVELKRAEAKHERGDFMVLPPRTVPPKGEISFSSVETPNAKEQGCKGFVEWQVGSPPAAVWRIEWDNPEGAKNTSKATLTPQTAGFSSQDVIGQGEDNVPVSFTLSGAGAGPTPPGPGPVPPGPGPVPPGPGPDVPFDPPVEAKQPTLRKGDKSGDGWVEYAQLLLNFHLQTNLAQDGDFGNTTLQAVLKFQKEKKLQVDGTIGNQTWAALREGAPEKPSTDGRTPHTFVEKGEEARWLLESKTNNVFIAAKDRLQLAVQTVGDTPIDASVQATVRVTAPGAKPRVVQFKLGLPQPKQGGVGFTHEVDIDNFRKRFPSVPPDAPITEYLVEAFLPKELGGDFYSGKVRE